MIDRRVFKKPRFLVIGNRFENAPAAQSIPAASFLGFVSYQTKGD